uniref:Transmembrane protein n=1 Tax=Cannabis sativa TaxID=3483 RepID=A0A803P9X5_CANSA
MVGRWRRNEIVLGLAVVIILGTAVYFRLWSIDYSASSFDADLLRRQFDLANREALDESAEWRARYDEEAVKTAQCFSELKQVKESSKKDDHDTGNANQKLELLQKALWLHVISFGGDALEETRRLSKRSIGFSVLLVGVYTIRFIGLFPPP